MFADRVKVFVDIDDNQNAMEKIPELRSGVVQQIEKIEEINPAKKQYEITFLVAKKRTSLMGSILSKKWIEHAEIMD
jgi:hypothetical protein